MLFRSITAVVKELAFISAIISWFRRGHDVVALEGMVVVVGESWENSSRGVGKEDRRQCLSITVLHVTGSS